MTNNELRAGLIGNRLYCNNRCWGTICNVAFHRNPTDYCTIKTTSEGADDHSPRSTSMCRDELEELCRNKTLECILECGSPWIYRLIESGKEEIASNARSC